MRPPWVFSSWQTPAISPFLIDSHGQSYQIWEKTAEPALRGGPDYPGRDLVTCIFLLRFGGFLGVFSGTFST